MEKPPIFILHGWSYTQEKWKPLFNMLKKQYVSSTLLNIPGLDEPISEPWNIDNYVTWLYQKVEKYQKGVVLIGGSNGGRICLNFALKYPKVVSHLFLIDSAGIYQSSFWYRFKVNFLKVAAKAGKLFTKSLKLKRLLYQISGNNDYVLASDIMKKTLLNLIESDRHLDLTHIKCATTIIWGGHDRITPLWMGQKMHRLISSSKLNIIRNAGHGPQFSHPQDIYAIIRSQLASV